jgi:hypothetical protein
VGLPLGFGCGAGRTPRFIGCSGARYRSLLASPLLLRVLVCLSCAALRGRVIRSCRCGCVRGFDEEVRGGARLAPLVQAASSTKSSDDGGRE